jgi:hypothetical protein
MKSFQTYIYELNKPSEFRIKLAGINPTGPVMDSIKNALEAYQLESVSTVKSLPIQEHREFPQWGGPCEAYQFDVKLAYPTTSIAVRQLIKERAQINVDWICVRNLNEEEYTEEAEQRGKDHTGALLDEEELKADKGGQELAGQSRIGSLLKELESRKFDFAQDSNEAGKTTNDLPQGNVSPEGTKQNTIYRKPKGN